MLVTAARCAVKFSTGTCELRYGVRHLQPKRCTYVRVGVYVCIYGGQPERCTYYREYVYAYVYEVRHVRTEWCSYRTEVRVHALAQCSACAV